MDSAPEKPRQEAPAPSTGVRLAWWFGIYIAGQVPLITHGYGHGDFMLLPLLSLFFPQALGYLIWPIATVLPQFMVPVVWVLAFFGGFVFYGWHLYATLKADTRRRFDILLVVLVLAVLASQWNFSSVVLTN